MVFFLEVIASFIAGIVSMPFLLEGYVFTQTKIIQNFYTEQCLRMDRENFTEMHELSLKYNKAVEHYNKTLSRMEKKLRNHGLFVETDENDNEIVVKKVPVKMSFKEWLEQKKKELLRGR